MRKPLAQHPLGQTAGLIPERSEEAISADLQEAAALNEAFEVVAVPLDHAMSFGLSEDRDDSGVIQFVEYSIDHWKRGRGQFQQHMPSQVGDGHNFAVADLFRQFFLAVDVCPWDDLHGDIVSRKPLGELPSLLSDLRALVVRVHAELSRRGDDRLDTVGGRQSGHERCLLPTAGTVVQFGEQMAVDIHQGLGETHGWIRKEVKREVNRLHNSFVFFGWTKRVALPIFPVVQPVSGPSTHQPGPDGDEWLRRGGIDPYGSARYRDRSKMPRMPLVKHAAIGPIAIHLPERVETNEDLKRECPDWDMDVIARKTGIRARHIAAPGECASDLAVAAAEKLFRENGIDRGSIDFLLLCTQTPDYPLPTTACLLQDRLGLPTSVGAIDFNLGCSGFVYGLALADGLIRSGAARRVLLLTAETYSKFIHPADRSLRTIFGDAAAATLIEAADEPSMSAFRFGTDGKGADTLLVAKGGARPLANAIRPRHRHRWPSDLYMDGPSLISFTVAAVPQLVDQILAAAQLSRDDIDLYLLHQATYKMLAELRESLGVPAEKIPLAMENVGNTVSSTLPILIDSLRRGGGLRPGAANLLIGFGVGWSWAGCVWRETWPTARLNTGGT